MSSTEDVPIDRVARLFSNKTVLITGASGFLGKVLLEKLLRGCPEIRKIYAIVRPKPNFTSSQRLEKILLDPLFDTIKGQDREGILEKVEAIDGDLSQPDLGLSKVDRWKLTYETEIVYHCAATVKFDDPFVKTILLNVRGTKLMLELAQQCQKLMIFCHSSTAYCHENQEIVYERFYESPANPHEIIKLCESVDASNLDSLGHWIRGYSANNYSFSKALTEALVEEQIDRMPIIIQRPCSVVPTWKDPIPGWTDNLNGVVGLSAAVGKGVARTVYGNGDLYLDYLSVDVVVHGMICTAFDFLTDGSRRIYNLTNSGDTKLTTRDIFKIGVDTVQTRVAFDTFFWYPDCELTNNIFVHNVKLFLFQLLPAILMDMLLRLFGIKPFLLRIQRKIVNGYAVFKCYFSRSWIFDKENFKVVINRLNAREREIYKIDIKELDIVEYFNNAMRGYRRFIFKEKDEHEARGLRRVKRMWYIDYIVKMLLLFGFIYYVYGKSINRMTSPVTSK